MSNFFRVGILGAGWAGSSHAAAYSRLPNVTVNALWSQTRARAEKLAEQLKQPDLQIYDHWQDLIEEADVDIISVTTPELLRRGPVIAALEQGCHVLVEKPLSVAFDDAKAMVEAAQKADAVTAICLNWRYAPGTQLAWEGLREGWIGRLLDLQMVWRAGLSPKAVYEVMPWHSEGANVLGAGGSHDFDRVRFLTGLEFLRLVGRVRPISFSKEPNYSVHGTYSLIAELTEDVLGDFRLTVSPGQNDWYLVLNGEEGTLTVTNESVVRQGAGEAVPTPIEIPTPKQIPGGIDLIQHTWNRLIEDFVTAVHNGDKVHASVPHLPTLIDGLRTQELIEAAQRAEKGRRWVELDELR